MRPTFRRSSLLVVALAVFATFAACYFWQPLVGLYAQKFQASQPGYRVGSSTAETDSLESLQASLDALRVQVRSIEEQMRALQDRIERVNRTSVVSQDGEFLGVYRVAGSAPHSSGTSLAMFRSDGPRPDTLRPIDGEVHHVCVNPQDGRLFGVGNHRIVELDSNTLELKELPIDAALPEFSWPCGMTFDTVRRRAVVASLGGEGYLYAFDPAARTWSLIASLQNVDLAGLAYDAGHDQLVGLEVGHEGGASLHTFAPSGARIATRDISAIVPRGQLGQHDCQLAVVGDRAIIIGSSHYDSATGPHRAHDPKLFVVELSAQRTPIDSNQLRPGGSNHRSSEVVATAAPAGAFQPIDLQPFASQALDEPFHLAHMTENNLGQVPRGNQQLDGVIFNVGDQCIQLAGTLLTDKPISSGPMPLGHRAVRLHFLHASGWGEGRDREGDLGFIPDGTQVAKYVVRYSDGQEFTVPVLYGKDLRGWWKFHDDLPETEAKVAWQGANGTTSGWGVSLRLYHSVWINPRPEADIEAVSFDSVNNTVAAPFCVAITAETTAPAD